MYDSDNFSELPGWLQTLWIEYPGPNATVAREAEKEWRAMSDALMGMLFIFDRDLMEGTIGRGVCDEAIKALKGKSE